MGVSSQPEQLRDRTKAFALRIIRLYRSLPYRTDTQVLGKQLLRCGTSVAANYRAVCRARSKAEFVARMGIVVEEADEAILWLELMTESGIVSVEKNEGAIERGERTDVNFLGITKNGEECSVSFSIAKSPDHTIAQFL
jgi:four helix bundle protein